MSTRRAKKGPANSRPLSFLSERYRQSRFRSRSSSASLSLSTSWTWTPIHPLLLPQIPAPTSVVSPPAPTTETGPDCGTKMRLRLESAATECDPEDCGMVSIRTLVPSITPSTAACCAAVGHGGAVLQFLLDPV